MPLGSNTKAFFEKLKKDEVQNPRKSFNGLSVKEVREICSTGFEEWVTPFPSEVTEQNFIEHIISLKKKKIRIHSYIPDDLKNETRLPTIVYFYGGGFCLDLYRYQHSCCATIAKHAKCQILTVDYPLAPEHSAKEIIDICYETLIYLYKNNQAFKIDIEAFMLSGCSSGGTLAALLTNRSLAQQDIKISQQILITPLVDLSLENHKKNFFLSYQQEDLTLPEDALEYYANSFAPNVQDKKLSSISPLYETNWKNLPPTTIIVGEFDALRGDGTNYYEMLKKFDCSVKLITCAGQTHNFLSCRGILNDGEDPAIIAAEEIKEHSAKKNTPSLSFKL